ncbi:MAG TPA: permease-like cell division protein FtsX [Gemmatimonadaceae bacterium]|nr:permease-like cell division protein FtsX [Gemmatimonadaceae bacterium]HEU5174040.1 permease-like cell division protein FtsX [Gemmatimonadaceae bacterium]
MSLSVREAFVAFRRAPLLSALSVTTIAFSLFALGLFGLVVLNIRQALDSVEERVEIRAFAFDGTDAGSLSVAAGEIGRYPEVLRVGVITPEQALERAKREMGEFSDVFESSFLPTSLEVQLRPGFRDPTSVKRVASRLRSYEFIEDVRYGEDWITQLHRIRNIAGVAGVLLGLAFAIVAVIIIGATIRMAMMARAKEIQIMRLVGATDGFIRRPFLIEGALKGVAGGLLALGLTWLATLLLEHYLSFQTVFFDTRTASLGVLAGAVIGLLGSMVSVGRQLRHV